MSTIHHPSCTPYDQYLVWACAQCGEQESAEDLRDAAEKVLAAFDAGIFVRNVEHDHESDWAIKAFPHLKALGELQAAIAKAEREPSPKSTEATQPKVGFNPKS